MMKAGTGDARGTGEALNGDQKFMPGLCYKK